MMCTSRHMVIRFKKDTRSVSRKEGHQVQPTSGDWRTVNLLVDRHVRKRVPRHVRVVDEGLRE